MPSAVGDREPTFSGRLRPKMTDPNPSTEGKKQPRRLRRRWKIMAVVLAVPMAAFAAIPWGLATPPGQRWMLSRAGRAIAPGGIAWASLRVSWFKPTRLTRVVLRDPQGDQLIFAPEVTLDRNLGQLLLDRRRVGTLTLDRAAFDIERRADGTVDLYETIKPLISPNPRTDFTIVVRQGRLRFRSAILAAPLTAERADATIRVGPGPGPISWQVDLTRPSQPQGRDESSLAIAGRYEHWWEPEGSIKDLEITLKGRRWPLSVEGGGLAATGVVDGKLAFARRSGLWDHSGALAIGAIEATGPKLAGDHLRLERVDGSWELAQARDAGAGAGAVTWAIRRLDLDSPIVTLKTAGSLSAPPGATTRIEGALDLAALAGQVPHALRLREGITVDRGTARVRADSRSEANRRAWEVEADVSDLVAHDPGHSFTLESPATLSASLRQGNGKGGAWAIERMAARTTFLDATGEGNLVDGITLKARLDLGGFQRQLRDLVDFGALELAGKGDLAGYFRPGEARYESHLTATFRDLRVAGLTSSPIGKDEVRLDAVLDGPAGDAGLPVGWDKLQLELDAGSMTARLAATARGASSEGVLTFMSPLATDARTGRVEGRLTARWEDDGATIDQARLVLDPDEPGTRDEPVAIVARGRYDRDRGELVLTGPPRGTKTGAIALAPDGLRVAGIGRPGALRVDASMVGELASLGGLARDWGVTAPALADIAGHWGARATLREVQDGWQAGGALDVPALIVSANDPTRRRSEGPIRLAFKANYQPGRDRLGLDEIVLASRYATLEASGQVSDLKAARRAELLGTLTPDWKAISALLAERIEPGASISGRAHPVSLQGSMAGESMGDRLKALDGAIGLDLDGADIFGMNLGPTPVVLRARSGRFLVDPIDTTLNHGRLHLEPEVVLDDQGGATLRLGPTSTLVEARINDEVSHRVLAYAAPVLDNATRVRGQVSFRLREASMPILGPPGRTIRVAGAVLYPSIEFLPGAIGQQLFDLVGLADRPLVKLSEPVTLEIDDRRVSQRGLTIPFGRLNAITMEGWVDFDRNLSQTASLPLLGTMLRDRPVLGDVLGGLRISVPIRGTLAQPEVDRDAFNLAMKDLGKTVLERTAGRGAAGLMDLFNRPRNPIAPPPTLRERLRERRRQP